MRVEPPCKHEQAILDLWAQGRAQRQDGGDGGRWWCEGRGGPHLCLRRPPHVVVELVRPLGVCFDGVVHGGDALQGGRSWFHDQLVDPPRALGELLLVQLLLEMPIQLQALGVLLVAVAAAGVVDGVAGDAAGVEAAIVTHGGGW